MMPLGVIERRLPQQAGQAQDLGDDRADVVSEGGKQRIAHGSPPGGRRQPTPREQARPEPGLAHTIPPCRFLPPRGPPMLVPLLLLAAPVVIVAEGERFRPLDPKGWKATHQDDTYGSHTYGGMWMSQGGCLGAPADSENSVATMTVSIPAAGKYRVWSK